jgi:single-strand DNA-binding protein
MLIGNVGAPPEVRTAAGGVRVASFSLATSRRWADRSGGQQEKTDWHRVVAWDRLADLVQRGVRKGDRLYVEGRLEYRSWADPAGRTRYATEVVAEDLIPLAGPATAGAATADWEPETGSAFPADDDLPF